MRAIKKSTWIIDSIINICKPKQKRSARENKKCWNLSIKSEDSRINCSLTDSPAKTPSMPFSMNSLKLLKSIGPYPITQLSFTRSNLSTTLTTARQSWFFCWMPSFPTGRPEISSSIFTKLWLITRFLLASISKFLTTAPIKMPVTWHWCW